MKRNFYSYRTNIGMAIIAAIMLCSCAPGSEAPQRKKMPALNDADAIEGIAPFASTDRYGNSTWMTPGQAELVINGKKCTVITLSVADPGSDSATFKLMDGLKPFALPLLSSWAHQQQKGVMIDLTNHTSKAIRTDYLLERPGDFSIPVVVISDNASSDRLAALKSFIDEVPAVALKRLNRNDAPDKGNL